MAKALRQVLHMAKIEIGQKDGDDPSAKVDQLVSGQEFPLQVTFKHAHRKGLVIPSAKHDGVILPGVDTALTLNSQEQAWEVVMDVAGIAEIWRNDALGTLTFKAPAKAPSEAK